jgi:hypothetical protein
MAKDSIEAARLQIGERIAEVRASMARLSPLDLYARMDAIRKLAADNGIAALESLARNSAQLALIPGHRVAMRCALEHVDEAFECSTDQDTTAMLAALAVRLH